MSTESGPLCLYAKIWNAPLNLSFSEAFCEASSPKLTSVHKCPLKLTYRRGQFCETAPPESGIQYMKYFTKIGCKTRNSFCRCVIGPARIHLSTCVFLLYLLYMHTYPKRNVLPHKIDWGGGFFTFGIQVYWSILRGVGGSNKWFI